MAGHGEVARATDAILAEAETAGREVRAATGGGPGPGVFLSVRLAASRPRLATPSPRSRWGLRQLAVICADSRR